MTTFFKKRSYDLVCMFVTQLAISIFGLSLALAVPRNQEALRIGTSIFSIIFYLFLIYTRVWDLGYKDCAAFGRGTSGLSRLEGLYMGIAANTVNFITATLMILSSFIKNETFDAVAGLVSLLPQGMYIGLLAVEVNGRVLNSIGIMYFVITVPLIITSALAYLAGSHDFKIFGSRKSKQ